MKEAWICGAYCISPFFFPLSIPFAFFLFVHYLSVSRVFYLPMYHGTVGKSHPNLESRSRELFMFAVQNMVWCGVVCDDDDDDGKTRKIQINNYVSMYICVCIFHFPFFFFFFFFFFFRSSSSHHTYIHNPPDEAGRPASQPVRARKKKRTERASKQARSPCLCIYMTGKGP